LPSEYETPETLEENEKICKREKKKSVFLPYGEECMPASLYWYSECFHAIACPQLSVYNSPVVYSHVLDPRLLRILLSAG
jgi:diphthamide synthase subunit DPH2